jgi:hypothetical protein
MKNSPFTSYPIERHELDPDFINAIENCGGRPEFVKACRDLMLSPWTETCLTMFCKMITLR